MHGLQFFKLDLHTHTPASKCYLDKDHTAEQIVQAALDQGLAGIAVTDHNTAEWIDKMKQAGQAAGLVIFPGVEISLEQCHLIALFDPSVSQKDVENFLGAIDIQADEYGKSEAVCTKSIYDVTNKIHDRGGLAILAHIDSPKGIFHEGAKNKDDGKINVPAPLSKILNDAHYDAVECAAGRLPDGFDEVHQIHRFPAFYQASDNPDPEKPTKHSLKGLASLHSWFKLDQLSLEGLRQCFADPDVRIRLMNQFQAGGWPRIVSIKVGDDGFLRNQNFEFHEGLNSIIGGKGVGKSLAIEFLRFGLAQPPANPYLFSDHVGKLQDRLGIGNSVEIVYQTADGARYQIERQLANIRRNGEPETEVTCTNLDSGESYTGDIPVLLPILAYSQTEVIEIAKDRTAQLQLIDRFIDPRPHEQAIDALRAKLEQNDQHFHSAIIARDRLASLQLEIDTLQAQINTIDKSLENPLFAQMKAAEAKRTLLNERYEYMGALVDQAREWQEDVKSAIEDLPDAYAEDVPLNKTQEIALQARSQAAKSLKQIADALAAQKADISDVIMAWMPEYDKLDQEYTQLLAEIGGDKGAQERKRRNLGKQKTEFEKQAKDAQALVKNLEAILAEREELLNQLERAHFAYYETRQAKYEHLTGLSEGKLRLELNHSADRTTYENRLIDLLKGGAGSLSTYDRRRIAQNVLPRRFVQLVLDRNAVHLANEAEISDLWAARVIEKLWSLDDFTDVLALQHNCFPADTPAIRYRKGGDVYDELSNLSIGQKCTALLIIALCDGAMPVIIDQPEDALDIASVWEDIAKKLRRGKDKRQFILTTHNSSVAVGSDSDQFIVLSAGADSGRVTYTGAIDRQDVRQSVIEHLEGGDEPYKLRASKYNIK